MVQLESRDRPYITDPILDPIHFGFTDSIVRYHRLRATHPQAEIMMGVGNLTELTEADTAGINAVLMGMISELGIGNIYDDYYQQWSESTSARQKSQPS